MKHVSDMNDPKVAKALAHPLRVRILGVLEQRVATPKELAAELATSLEALSYHVRMLARLGLIELVEERQKRGAVEHHYRASTRPAMSAQAWSALPTIARQAAVASKLAQIGEQASRSAADGGFDREDAHLLRRPLALDEEAFAELSRALAGLAEEVDRIERRAGERLGGADAEAAVDAGLVLMLFAAASDPPGGSSSRG